MILNERGYERSTSQPTLYSTMPRYKTIEESNEPISTCLLDHWKNDAMLSFEKTKIGDEGRDLPDINNVFEALKSFERTLNSNSTIQDVTKFCKKASNFVQRTINIVDLKGGKQVFSFKSATNVQVEPYHLCFVQHSYHDVHRRYWLSITPKNAQNEPAPECKPLLKKTRSFSRFLKSFRKK